MRRKDYKHNLPPDSTPADSGDFKKGLLLGLLIGAVSTLLMYGYHVYRCGDNCDEQVARDEAVVSEPAATESVEPAEQTVSEAEPEREDPNPRIGDEELADFLRHSEVEVPGAADLYLLQASIFRTLEEAQALEQRVLSAGHKPTIRQITRDGDIWHSVQLGPFQAMDDADEVRLRLKRHGIDTTVKHYQR